MLGVKKMTLSQIEIKSLEPIFNEIATARGITLDEVIELYNTILNAIEQTESGKGKSRQYVLRRVKMAMDNHYANKQDNGVGYEWLYFGPVGRPKDWNDKLFEEVEKETKKPDGVLKLLEKGAIAFKTVNGQRIPVTDIIKFENKDIWIKPDGSVSYTEIKEDKVIKAREMTVFEGTEWDRVKPLIPRDYRTSNNSLPNWGYTQVLKHRYNMQVLGIGNPLDKKNDVRLINASIDGKYADATSDDFFFKKYKPFTWYQQSFIENEHKMKEYLYEVKTNSVSMKALEVDNSDLDDKLDSTLEEIYNKYGEEADKNGHFIPRVYFLSQIKEYFEYAVKTDKDGVIMKNENGRDMVKWNQIGIMTVNVSTAPTKKGPPMFILKDSAVARPVNAFTTESLQWIPKLPSTCLVAFRATRKNTRYDLVTKGNVPDPDNGDITISILGLMDVQNTEMPKIDLSKF